MSLRRLSTVTVAALCALALAATVASAANIVMNPGFETGDLTGWQVFGAGPTATVTVQSGDNGPAAAGTHNAFMDNQTPGLGLTLAYTTSINSATAGTIFYAFDLKGSAGPGGVFFVKILALTETGAVAGESPLMGNYAPAVWTTYQGSWVAPANTDHLMIQFMANTGAFEGSTSSMHVDNVSLDTGAVPANSTSWGRIKELYR